MPKSNFFPPLQFGRFSKTGRSYGTITVRSRGGGIAKLAYRNYLKTFCPNIFLYRFIQFDRRNYKSNLALSTAMVSKNKYIFFYWMSFKNFFPSAIFDILEHFDDNINYPIVKNYSTILPDYLDKIKNLNIICSNTCLISLPKIPPLINRDFSKFFSPTIKILLNIFPGSFIRLLELYPTKGVQFARSRYSYARLISKRGTEALIRLPSGKLITISVYVTACEYNPFLGPEKQINKRRGFYKAGQARRISIRPHVRGCAINPVDHPHGGRTGDCRPSVSPWSQLTKSYPTVKRK